VRKLRFDLYGGYADAPKSAEHTQFTQNDGETAEDFIERITNELFASVEQLVSDAGDDDED